MKHLVCSKARVTVAPFNKLVMDSTWKWDQHQDITGNESLIIRLRKCGQTQEYFCVSKLNLFGACKPKVSKEAVCTNKSPLNSHPISRKTFVLNVNWECCAPGNLHAINQTAAELHILHFTGDWDILVKKCGDKTDWSLGENDHGCGALCEGLQSVFRCQRSQRWS